MDIIHSKTFSIIYKNDTSIYVYSSCYIHHICYIDHVVYISPPCLLIPKNCQVTQEYCSNK